MLLTLARTSSIELRFKAGVLSTDPFASTELCKDEGVPRPMGGGGGGGGGGPSPCAMELLRESGLDELAAEKAEE